MLLEPGAWTSLTATQQATLVQMLPSSADNAALLGAVSAGAAQVARPRELKLNSTIFRTDVAKFQTDLTSGHLAKTWLAGADQAVRDRAAGAFDAWKRGEAESWWGQFAEHEMV